MSLPKLDSMRHYKAIKHVADSRGMPREVYHRDLTQHDMDTLRERGPGIPFVWMVHPDGTHLLHAGPVVKRDGDSSFRYPHNVVESFPEAAKGIYAWDGTSLRQLASAADAERFLRLMSCTCTPMRYSTDREDHPSPCPASRM